MGFFNFFKKKPDDAEIYPGRYKKILGRLGEKAAAKFLFKNGLRIIETNYENEFGEIDIIAEDKDTVVFVEVKTRTSDKFGAPEEAVDDNKQNFITQTSKIYLKINKAEAREIRYDIISIIHDRNTKKNEINWIKNAF